MTDAFAPTPPVEAQLLVLPLPPTINHYYYKGRILTKVGRAFRAEAQALARAAGIVLVAGSVDLDIHFYLIRGDGDNRLKGLFDSLNKIAYADDDDIVHHCVTKHRVHHYADQRTEIVISPYSV